MQLVGRQNPESATGAAMMACPQPHAFSSGCSDAPSASDWHRDDFFSHTDLETHFLNRLAQVKIQSLNDITVGQDEHEDVLKVAVFCLKHFVAVNWTGPFTQTRLLFDAIKDKINSCFEGNLLDLLVVDGCLPYPLVKDVFALLLCKKLFEILKSSDTNCKIFFLKSLFLHQRLLDEPSVCLKDSIDEIILQICNDESFLKTAELFLEFSIIKLYYGMEADANMFFKKASQLSSFEFSLTGVLGKRTKFQTFEVSQLVVEVKKTDSKLQSSQSSIDLKPDNVVLDDDTLLNDRDFTVDDDQKQRIVEDNIHPVDQCILLQKSCMIKESTCESEIAAREQMMAFVERVLRNPNNWTVFSLGLFLRSKLESHDHRKIERSVLQLQSLYDQTRLEEPRLCERIKYFFCVLAPSIWEIERQAAFIFRKLGALMTAIDIFVRLELWTDAVECLLRAEKIKEAEEIVTKQLEKHPDDPKMWYLMAIVKDCSVDLFRKSWELSKGTYSKPLRMLGKIFYDQKKYHDAAECLENALKVNSLFENSWFLLGCCYMNLERLEKALSTFQRVVVLNYENGQAWTNIATIQWTLQRPKEALSAFKTSVKFFFDNWKMWDNIVTTALACYEWKECFQAATKVVGLAPSADASFKCLVAIKSAVVSFKSSENADADPSDLNVTKNFFDLLAFCESSSLSSSFKYWLFYAECFEEFASADHDAIVECISKAYRCLSTVSLVDSPDLLLPACIVIEKLHNRTKNLSAVKKFIAKYDEYFSQDKSFIHIKRLLEGSE